MENKIGAENGVETKIQQKCDKNVNKTVVIDDKTFPSIHILKPDKRTERTDCDRDGDFYNHDNSCNILKNCSSCSPKKENLQQAHTLHDTSKLNCIERCVGCFKPIREKYLLKVMNQSWHEDCLKCSCCNCRLGEVGSTLFTRANLMLCKRDYLRLFGATGNCSSCFKSIPAFEMVMKARDNVYHLDCFSCYHCNHRFCIGDRYYLHDDKILCEVDYEGGNLWQRLKNNKARNIKTSMDTVSKNEVHSCTDDINVLPTTNLFNDSNMKNKPNIFYCQSNHHQIQNNNHSFSFEHCNKQIHHTNQLEIQMKFSNGPS